MLPATNKQEAKLGPKTVIKAANVGVGLCRTFNPNLLVKILDHPYYISDQSFQSLYTISDQKGFKPYPLASHIPI